MPCYRPLRAFRFHTGESRHAHPSGKLKLFFNVDLHHLPADLQARHEVLELPCGRCIGCKLRRVSDWALRCVHEASLHERASFLTLTYRTSRLPPNRSLLKRDHQLFFKKLRQVLARLVHGPSTREHPAVHVRYFMCGEYGAKKGRPHYHAVLFGWDFPDRELVPNPKNHDQPLFTSKLLEETWGHGDVRIGEVTPASAAYVARYTLKKLRAEEGDREYLQTGREAPYVVMSKGIGRAWFKTFRSDVFPRDSCLDPDTRTPRAVPRFYDKLLQEVDEAASTIVKEDRVCKSAKGNLADRTPERLRVREQVTALKVGALVRHLDKENSQ